MDIVCLVISIFIFPYIINKFLSISVSPHILSGVFLLFSVGLYVLLMILLCTVNMGMRKSGSFNNEIKFKPENLEKLIEKKKVKLFWGNIVKLIYYWLSPFQEMLVTGNHVLSGDLNSSESPVQNKYLFLHWLNDLFSKQYIFSGSMRWKWKLKENISFVCIVFP